MRAKLFGVLAAFACVAAIWGVSFQAGLAKDETKTMAMADGPNVPAPDMVDNFRLVDQHLVSHDLYQLGDAPAIVIAIHGNGCPIVRNTGADLEALKKQFGAQGVEFLMINPNLQDKREAIAAEAKEYGVTIPILKDTNQLVAEQLGVTRTAEIYVIDPKTWEIAYRGPINDRVTYERQKAKAGKHYVADAIKAVMAGKKVAAPRVQTVGCLVDMPERDKRAAHAQISYSKTIAPILEAKCVSCHQEGGIGPWAMTNYDMVKGFAPMIRETIRTDRMPPWNADPHVGAFSDDKSLSAAEIKTLVHWIEAGAPRGDGPDPLGAVVRRAPEWPLGKPDLVLDIPAFKIPATGVVDYQRPIVVNPLKDGKWLRAATIKVGQRQGVHHVLTGYMDTVPADGRGSETRWGASVGGYAVGSESEVQPKDVGTFLPPGGAVGFQMHYTPFGKEVVDQSKIALYFHDKKPKMQMRGFVIMDLTISIPPNTARHEEIAYATFPKDALLYSAFPHAHYRAHSSDLTIRYPDGSEKLLLALPRYDFNWQRAYEFAERVKIPAGSKLIARYIYDNSKRNPANPDPNINVTWGEQSFQEMFFTALRFRWLDETTDKPVEYTRELRQGSLIGMLDDNVNGQLEQAEFKGPLGAMFKSRFATLDKNADGALDRSEMSAAGGGRLFGGGS